MTTVLDREMYTEAGAARLLRVPPGTLHYWLEGGTRGKKVYKPVIREEATGSRSVTWAEFVEASLLRQYRRKHNVPMLELRGFIDRLRERMGAPYPLAHYRPYVGDRRLIFEAQNEAKLGADFALVAEVSGQYILTSPSQDFFERVTWEGDIAARWRPDANADSPVIIDPDIRSGRPSVGGISTEILWEQAEAGEDERDLADTYGLNVTQVRWALAYELTLQTA
ncbi:MAG TPA: hypothetical protein VIJ07_19865 [Dermatophilaceae bacterium]|jgi:uncharacterized protein (DUF433 family)